MNTKNRFYVYALVDPNGYAFYIGKGTNGRVYDHFQKSQKNHNFHKYYKIQKILRENPSFTKDDMVQYLKTEMSEEEALKFEAEFIEHIGLDNLTNICPGGEGGPGYKGEEHGYCKISRQEAEWIRWLEQNSKRKRNENFEKYGKHWSDELSLTNYETIASGTNWKHVEPEKPPFFEKQWDDLRYTAVEEYLTTDLSQRQAAEKYGFKRHHLNDWLQYNYFSLVSRFEEDYGMSPDEYLKKEEEKKNEKRYEAVEEYLTTDLTMKEAAEKHGFNAKQLDKWLHRNSFNIVSRFEEDYKITPKESLKKEEEKKNKRRYKAVEEYLTTDLTMKEAAEKHGFKQQHLNDWLRRNYFSLVSRFEEEHNTTTRYSPTQPGDQLNLFPTTGKA